MDRNSLQHLFDYNTMSGPFLYAPGYYENIWLNYASPRQIRTTDVHKVTDGDVLITTQLELDFYIDVVIFKGDLSKFISSLVTILLVSMFAAETGNS